MVVGRPPTAAYKETKTPQAVSGVCETYIPAPVGGVHRTVGVRGTT